MFTPYGPDMPDVIVPEGRNIKVKRFKRDTEYYIKSPEIKS